MRIFALLLLTSTLFLGACSKESQRETDDNLIQEYLQDNNITAQSTNSGLYYVIDEPGEGDEFPNTSSSVKVHYTGSLLNGTIFESSVGGDPLTISLRSVIPGWTEGIPKFKPGGKGTLYIPSHLGYGERESSSIPKNSVLIFDIELINFY